MKIKNHLIYLLFFAFSHHAIAADISTPLTTTQTYNSDGEVVTITSMGSITTSDGSDAVAFEGSTSDSYTLNNSGSISSSGNAINVKDGVTTTINNNGAISGDVALGSSINSSFNHNSGASITGTISSGISDQVIHLNGGAVAEGSNIILEGNSKVYLNANYEESDFFFNINGQSDNEGILIINEGVTALNWNVIGNNKTLKEIQVLNNANFMMDNTVKAQKISVAGNVDLNYLTGFSAAIEGFETGQGSFALKSNYTAMGAFNNTLGVGATQSLDQVIIDNNAVFTNKAALHANNIIVNGVLNLESGPIKGTVTLSDDAMIRFSKDFSVADFQVLSINGALDNQGTMIIDEGFNVTTNNTIGSTTALKEIQILNGATLTVGDTVKAQKISLSGNLDLSYLPGFSAAIEGYEANQGNVTLSSNAQLWGSFTNSSGIGATNAISQFTIGSSSIMNNNAAFNANNIDINGALNLGRSASTINGNVAAADASTLNISNATHTINGDLFLSSGHNLEVSITGESVAGKLIVNGAAQVEEDVNLKVSVASNPTSNYRYINNGTRYLIIDGSSGSNMSKINDDNINVNDSGSNTFQLLTFSTSVQDDDLFLNASRKSAAQVTNDRSSQNVYNAINTIADSATGALKDLQAYLDNASSTAEIQSALQSVTPQADNGIILGSVTVANNSVTTVENRLDTVRAVRAPSSNNYIIRTQPQPSAAPIQVAPQPKRVFTLKSGVSSGDEDLKDSVWAQTFGTKAKQGDLGNNDGYRSKATGFAFGYDKTIAKDTVVGASLSYADSSITSQDNQKRTQINTYQANAYASKISVAISSMALWVFHGININQLEQSLR